MTFTLNISLFQGKICICVYLKSFMENKYKNWFLNI